MENNNLTPVPYEVYIKNGIMYHNFYGEFTVEKSFDVQKQAIKLIEEKKIQTIPIIVYLKDIDKSSFKLSIGNYGKVIKGYDVIKHASGIWIVTNSPDIKRIAKFVSKIFFFNKLSTTETLEQAEQEAQKFISQRESILEQAAEK